MVLSRHPARANDGWARRRRATARLGIWVTCLLALFLLDAHGSARAEGSPISWEDWSADLFERAKREERFILLDMEAVWCHWCHVMDAETYSDPGVVEVIQKHYIPVKVDQDSRPDLSARYERYGWPATVIFGPDGTEIVKRRGFVPANVMKSILDAVVVDPSPVPGIQVVLPETYAAQGALPAEARSELEQRHDTTLDREKGGLDGPYRYLPWEAAEYALRQVEQGDETAKPWLRTTLDASRKLLDPAFGGVYQYSVKQDWNEPHFEKIMSFQAENLRLYALAYGVLKNPVDLDSARNIVRFVDDFLTSPDGSFYTSMDADLVRGEHSGEYFSLSDAERRKLGIPRVDTSLYSRENGWMIEALATLAETTGDAKALERARRAAKWVIAARSIEGGGFRHDEKDPAGPYLGDTLAMGRAFLQLYRASAEREWLERAHAAARFIEKSFRRDQAGYISAVRDSTPIEPLPQFDQNIQLARFSNLLSHYTGDASLRDMATHALRYVTTPDVYGPRREVAGVLLADSELSSDPMHLTVVGSKLDGDAAGLFQATLRQGSWYKRVEWWDQAEGPLPNPDIQYPKREDAAAYVCSERACSAPIRRAEDIARFLDRMRSAAAGRG